MKHCNWYARASCKTATCPQWAQERLASADEDQLLKWAEAILSAASLQDLFGPGPHQIGSLSQPALAVQAF